MIEVVIAIILLISMQMSTHGIVAGTYVLFGFVGLHIFMTSFASISIFYLSVKSFEKIKAESTLIPNRGAKTLLQIIYGIVGIHLFQIGYPLIAGMLAVTVVIALFNNLPLKEEG